MSSLALLKNARSALSIGGRSRVASRRGMMAAAAEPAENLTKTALYDVHKGA